VSSTPAPSGQFSEKISGEASDFNANSTLQLVQLVCKPKENELEPAPSG
jgi:hypothetical protein